MKMIIYLLPLLVTSILASCNESDENNWWNKTDELTKDDIGKVVNEVKVNGQMHKVRLIGVDEDKNSEGKTIHTTWEFVNLLSDSKGYSLATYWNNTKDEGTASDNYMNSSIRKALTNEGNGKIYWFEKDGKKYSAIYKKSVLDMLPKSLTKVLIAPSKCVYIYNNEWKEQTVEDKLFLLSPAELGRIGHECEEKTTKPYSYYDGANYDKRIKKQIKGSEGARKEPLKDIEGLNTDRPTNYSFAGWNSSDSYEGGQMWLRSPYKHFTDSEKDKAWYISEFGSFSNDAVYSSAVAIAPAFCI